MKSDTLENFQKSIKAIQVSLKSDKKQVLYMGSTRFFLTYLSQLFLE